MGNYQRCVDHPSEADSWIWCHRTRWDFLREISPGKIMILPITVHPQLTLK